MKQGAIKSFPYILLLALMVIALLSAIRISILNVALKERASLLEVALSNEKSGNIDQSVLISYIENSNKKVYSRLATEIVTAAEIYGKKYSISPILSVAVMRAESEFNINAESKDGALGLMQVLPSAWNKELKDKEILSSEQDLYDPYVNIESGCYIMRSYLNETKDFKKAMDKYLGVNSKDYTDKIGKYVGELWMLSVSKDINATYNLK